MMNKFRKVLALMLALMMIIVTAPSFADEGEIAEINHDGSNIDEEVTPEDTLTMTEEPVRSETAEPEKAEPETTEPQEAPKAEEPEAAEPKAEEPKAEEPKEESGAAETEAEELQAEELKTEEADTEVPAIEEQTDAAPVAEEADAEVPITEEPAEVPAAEEAAEEVKEETGSEEEKAVEPKAEKHEEEDGEQAPEVTVTVTTVITGENEMKLIALVNDPENRAYTYQWQVSDSQGASYSDIADETSDVLRIELTEENRNNFWRVRVKRK